MYRVRAMTRTPSSGPTAPCSERSELEELDGLVPEELLLRLVLEPEPVHLVEALLPWQPVGPPEGAVLAHAAADKLDDLGLQVLGIPGVHAEPDVVPLVADRDQLLDPGPAGVGADHLELGEVARDLVQVHGAGVLAGHGLQHAAHLHGDRHVQLHALGVERVHLLDRKSTRLNYSHGSI